MFSSDNNKARESEGVESVCTEVIILSNHGSSLGSSRKVIEDIRSAD